MDDVSIYLLSGSLILLIGISAFFSGSENQHDGGQSLSPAPPRQ